MSKIRFNHQQFEVDGRVVFALLKPSPEKWMLQKLIRNRLFFNLPTRDWHGCAPHVRLHHMRSRRELSIIVTSRDARSSTAPLLRWAKQPTTVYNKHLEFARKTIKLDFKGEVQLEVITREGHRLLILCFWWLLLEEAPQVLSRSELTRSEFTTSHTRNFSNDEVLKQSARTLRTSVLWSVVLFFIKLTTSL